MVIYMVSDFRYFEAIAERALAGRDNRRAIEARVRRQIERERIAAGVTAPPVDLQRMSRHLGVKEIRCVPLAMNGRIVEDDGVVVEINEKLSPFLRKVTLAHELSHIVLEPGRVNRTRQRSGIEDGRFARGSTEIEALCDLAARQLLLPARWLLQRIGEASPSIGLARAVGEESACDLGFVLMRLIEMGASHCRLLWWSRVGTGFCATQSYPRTDEVFLARLTPAGGDVSLLRDCEDGTRGVLTLRAGEEETRYRAECVAIGDEKVLSLLIFKE